MPPRNNRKERSSPERQTKPPESQMQPPPSPKHDPNIPPSSSSSDADNFSSPSMKPIVFPPGFKFVPTDEDLIFHYLKPFLEGSKNSYPNVQIHRVNIYESNPEQLSKEYEKGNDKEWFFITERTKIRKGGKMQNRSDNGGYWKALTAAKKIKAGQGVVGYKTVLDYQIGKQGNSVKSDWLMHEYWSESNGDNKKVDHALCRIFLTPRVQKRKAEEEDNEKKKKKRKKKEGVATVVDVEALEEEVDQPCNAAFQRPQFCLPPQDPCQPHQSLIQQQQSHNYAYQQQLHNVAAVIDVEALEEEVDQPCNAAFQQPQFCIPPLDSCQPHQSQLQQPQNYAYQPQQQLHNVANQPHQPQIFLVSLDSLQPQIFLVSQDSLQPQQPQAQEQEQLPILDISDELPEMINFQQLPVISDDAALYQDGDEESINRGSLEEIVREGMKKH